LTDRALVPYNHHARPLRPASAGDQVQAGGNVSGSHRSLVLFGVLFFVTELVLRKLLPGG